MRQDIDIDELMTETWLTVTMLKKGAVTLDGPALYNKCVEQVESVREALERAGYDDASVEHISYAQCALLDETVMSRKPEKSEEGDAPKVDEGQVAWRKAPLQARFFGSLRAGEALWDRIAEVLRQPTPNPAVLTCYHRVIALGFQGLYSLKAVSVRSDAVTTGEHYRYAAPYREAGDDTSPEPETESGAFYARIHHERELNKSARIHLFSNASHLTPGQVLEPQGDVITALQEGVLLTLVTYRGARDSRLHVSVWGMPYTERYCFRPAEIPRPEIQGTLPARIESREKNDIYAHLDGQGRYRVKPDFDREGTEPGYGYLWLRMAKPYAGETLGWHTPLIDGTEVAIAYSNGDIDLPYIAYALHDPEHPDPVTRDNHTRNVLRTPANNKLRMEDKRGEEHIRLATEYGKTQLNSGHLVDSLGQRRGQGTELRTDEHGVIRAGKGLFVTADAQAKAQGDALVRDAALKEIDRLNRQLQQLEIAAEQAQALKADVDSQIQMFEQRLKPLNEALLFSAPEGMAFTSGEHLQMTATKNIAINSGGDTSTGVMGNMTALAGEKLGLFARTGQLCLKASEGPVEVQAQNAAMRLFAEKKLTLSSASDISLVGKKRITLIGGGSYLRLEAGKVEYGTTATYIRKVKRTMAAGAATLPLNIAEIYPVITEKICIPCLLKAIQANDAIVQGA